MKKKKRRLDASTYLLFALVAAAAIYAYSQDPALPLAGLRATGRALSNVWIELALGFLLAGLVDVLIPAQALVRWLGPERGSRGILVGWAAGLLIPGGPYLLFPIVAGLYEKGAAPGALITLVSAKTLVSPVRMLTYEAPLLGWPITLARLIPGLLVPPILGVTGQWLFRVFGGGR